VSSALGLGLNTGYWAGGPPPGIDDAIAEAEQLGLDSVWTAEAYGSDGLTPLAWWGARTQRMKLGTAITQMSARQPAATAMAAMTLDHSRAAASSSAWACRPAGGGGWYGMPFEKPLARTREYIGILRDIWARKGPVTNDGPHYPLPLPGGTGLGKPLKSSIHPLREDIPIYLGAEGPKNIALCAELCDGWLAMLFSPHHENLYRGSLEEGWARPGARRGPDEFDVAASVPLIVTDDVEAAADSLSRCTRCTSAAWREGSELPCQRADPDGPTRTRCARSRTSTSTGSKDEAAAKIPHRAGRAARIDRPGGQAAPRPRGVARVRSSPRLLVTGDRETIRTAAELLLG